jgi:hypothetical protein
MTIQVNPVDGPLSRMRIFSATVPRGCIIFRIVGVGEWCSRRAAQVLSTESCTVDGAVSISTVVVGGLVSVRYMMWSDDRCMNLIPAGQGFSGDSGRRRVSLPLS